MTRCALAVVFAALFALTACDPPRAASEPAAPGAGSPAPGPPTAPPPGAPPPLPPGSVYHVGARLLGTDGREARLDRFRGHPVVASMFYGSCAYACPLLLQRVRDVERALEPAAREQVRVLLVSFDAERDTPDALARLGSTYEADPARWLLTSAGEAAAREVAAVLGIQYRRLADGSFSHSSSITVLDRDGVPVAVADGLDAPLDAVITRLTALAAQP